MNTASNESVSARFGMTRDNFILDPISDTRCFARDDIPIREIAESLDIDVLTGLAPKRLVSGPYGAGKTHTLMKRIFTLAVLRRHIVLHPSSPPTVIITTRDLGFSKLCSGKPIIHLFSTMIKRCRCYQMIKNVPEIFCK